MKERRNEFDLMRAISALAIVLFHYSYAFVQYDVGGEHVDFMMHANGTWGALFVSLFFMLSGASLYYNWGGRIRSFAGKYKIRPLSGDRKIVRPYNKKSDKLPEFVDRNLFSVNNYRIDTRFSTNRRN